MTVAALRALLDQELPHVPHHPAPHLPRTHFTAKENPVQTATAAAQPTTPPALRTVPGPPQTTETLPVGKLLAWGDHHPDKGIQAHAALVRASLAELRARHQADKELEAITAEAEDLEKRLAEIRQRQAQLQPKRTRTRRDYDTAEVRAWARANGHTVPDRGQIPKKVLQAWREREKTA